MSHSGATHKEEDGTGIVIEEAEIVDCDGRNFIFINFILLICVIERINSDISAKNK